MLASSDVIAFASTTELQTARSFYAGVLGLRVVDENPYACVFDAHGTMLRVTLVDDVATPGYTVLGWRVADIDAAKAFYTDFLGLTTEEFNLGWVARFTCPETGARVQLVTRDATAPEDSVMSVPTDDVDAAWAQAQEMGLEVVRPLTKEAWGVRRFLVRAPDGNIVNVVDHRD